MANEQVVLDGATTGTIGAGYMRSKVVPMYVRSGSADVIHDGDVIVTLAVGDRKVCDGLPIGTELSAQALEDNTTLVFLSG